MRKRELIGIIFLAVSIFLLLVSFAINVYVENEERKEKENNFASSFGGISFFNVKETGEKDEGG